MSRMTGVKFEMPKNKEKALNLAAYILTQVAIYKRKEVNLVTSKSNTEEKIKRLKETLASIETDISRLKAVEGNWTKQLKDLQTEFHLTEAEILETKSELLRRKMNSLREGAGVEKTEETEVLNN